MTGGDERRAEIEAVARAIWDAMGNSRPPEGNDLAVHGCIGGAITALDRVRDARNDEGGWAPNERQAVLDCINLYGDETLHAALDSADLLSRDGSRPPQGEDDEAAP